MVFGAIAFAGGWLFQIAVGAVELGAERPCSELGGYAFIPLVGGLVHAATYDGCAGRSNDPWAIGAPHLIAGVAQVGGLAALLIAFVLEDAEALELESLTFVVPGADVGVGMRATF